MTEPAAAAVLRRVRAQSELVRAKTDEERAAVIARVRLTDPALADELAAKGKG